MKRITVIIVAILITLLVLTLIIYVRFIHNTTKSSDLGPFDIVRKIDTFISNNPENQFQLTYWGVFEEEGVMIVLVSTLDTSDENISNFKKTIVDSPNIVFRKSSGFPETTLDD